MPKEVYFLFVGVRPCFKVEKNLMQDKIFWCKKAKKNDMKQTF